MQKKYLSLIIFLMGILSQIISMIIGGNLFVHNPKGDIISDILGYITVFIYLISLPGIYFGVEYMIKEKKFSLFCTLGIILNLLWFCGFTFGIILLVFFGAGA